ncbi:MAG: PTS sugar transporter subunit IIB [Deltaproteobacteria bacterium]|nr:PTS sugar transporter subunit IIB [Deltaproteobacteria bacterium]
MIALVRVDNRLIHGQILETWLPALRARRVLVADDEAARSPLSRSALTLALPDDIPAEVVAVDAADWAAAAAAPVPVLVLFRDVEGLRRAIGRGLTPAIAPKVNVGNVHFGPGRRQITPSLFLKEEELLMLRDLAAAGFRVEARAVPGDSPTDVEEMGRRFQQARG